MTTTDDALLARLDAAAYAHTLSRDAAARIRELLAQLQSLRATTEADIIAALAGAYVSLPITDKAQAVELVNRVVDIVTGDHARAVAGDEARIAKAVRSHGDQMDAVRSFEAGVKAGLGAALQWATEGYHCLACGTKFFGSAGHFDEECPRHRASWDGLSLSDVAEVIRAIDPATIKPD